MDLNDPIDNKLEFIQVMTLGQTGVEPLPKKLCLCTLMGGSQDLNM